LSLSLIQDVSRELHFKPNLVHTPSWDYTQDIHKQQIKPILLQVKESPFTATNDSDSYP
jgi:hypothetical protein